MRVVMRDPKTIGPYRIVAEIARGHLATIHVATHRTDREALSSLVIKRVLPELAEVSGWGELLADEALLLASIRHPNVVACHGSGRDEGQYVAVDHVDGDSLQGLLSRSGAWRQPRLLLPVIADVLRGLAAVHAAVAPDGAPLRVVHQALHARHILVGSDGVSRIADFTQARVQRLALGSCRTERLRGGLLAPEQALDPQSVGLRADLFVLGATLWEGLTGESLAKLMPAHATWTSASGSVPKPSSLGLAPPSYFDQVCLRALERDPQRRFSSAGEMLEELLRAVRRAGSVASPAELGHWVRTTCAARGKLDAIDTTGARSAEAEGARANAVHVAGTLQGQPTKAESVSPPDANASRIKATRATMIGMPPIDILIREAQSLPPAAEPAEQTPPSVTVKPSAQAQFSKTLLGSPKVSVRSEATLQGGAGALGGAFEPIMSEPPSYRRDVAQAEPRPHVEEPRASKEAQGTPHAPSVLDPAREWSSAHDTRWVEFAVQSRQRQHELADIGRARPSSAPPSPIERDLGERIAAWVGTAALVASALLLGDLVMTSVQRWPNAPTLESLRASADSVAHPLGGLTADDRGQAGASAVPGATIGRRETSVPQPRELSPQPNLTGDAGAIPPGARSGRGAAFPTTAPSRVAPLPVAPARVLPPRSRPPSAAPTSAAPTSLVPTSAAPAGTAPAGIAPTSAAPASAAPASVAPLGLAPPAAGGVPRDVAAPAAAPAVRGVPSNVAPTGVGPQGLAPAGAVPRGLGSTGFAPRRSSPSDVASVGVSAKGGNAVGGQPSLPANPY